MREAGSDVLIVADGFSCREQYSHNHRPQGARHLSQVLQMALSEGPNGPAHPIPNGAAPKQAAIKDRRRVLQSPACPVAG